MTKVIGDDFDFSHSGAYDTYRFKGQFILKTFEGDSIACVHDNGYIQVFDVTREHRNEVNRFIDYVVNYRLQKATEKPPEEKWEPITVRGRVVTWKEGYCGADHGGTALITNSYEDCGYDYLRSNVDGDENVPVPLQAVRLAIEAADAEEEEDGIDWKYLDRALRSHVGVDFMNTPTPEIAVASLRSLGRFLCAAAFTLEKERK